MKKELELLLQRFNNNSKAVSLYCNWVINGLKELNSKTTPFAVDERINHYNKLKSLCSTN